MIPYRITHARNYASRCSHTHTQHVDETTTKTNQTRVCIKLVNLLGVTGTRTLHYYVDKKRCIWIRVCVAF